MVKAVPQLDAELNDRIAHSPFVWGALKGWSLADRKGADQDIALLSSTTPGSPDTPSSVAKVDSGYVLTFAGLARFLVDFGSKLITAFDVAPRTTQSTLTHLLFDQIAPRILAHEGYLVLHGSAVEISGEAVVFLGETGAGKSTLAASLHRAGHRLLGDDAVIVTHEAGQFRAAPVYPSLRLYPDTVSALLDDQAEVTLMAHYSHKQRVNLPALTGPLAAPLPIAAMFFLSGGTKECQAVVHQSGPAQTCINILEQSFSFDPGDIQRAQQRFAKAAKLVETVRAFEIEVPHDYAHLGEVHAMIDACIKGRHSSGEKAD